MRLSTARGLMRSRIHCRKIGCAVFHRSSSGYSSRPRPFDVEQRLLQQDQLRLNLHVEAARGLEQAQQHLREGDFLERLVEYGLANGAHRRFELVDSRSLGNPAGLDVQGRDARVVAIEKCHEIFRQIMLVAGCKVPTMPKSTAA